MEQGQNRKQQAFFHYQAFPLGDSAVVLQFGDSISPEILAEINSFVEALNESSIQGLVEWVPAYTTLTIFYDPWLVRQQGISDPYKRVLEQLQELAPSTLAPPSATLRVVEIPVCYGGIFGPDLDAVASHTNLTTAEVIRLHTAAEYLVYMIGFAPGFPYLGGLNKQLITPRKEAPRPRIPAGAVGIAGAQTGIYPLETPGGWQLIGRTPLRLFRPEAAQPSLLQAGDKVRFVAITPAKYQQLEEKRL